MGARPPAAREVEQLDEQPHAPGDPLGRVYTPAWLADAVVDLAHHRRQARGLGPPRTVLDPSVGSGKLLAAARRRWPDARLLGVDIDPTATGNQVADHFATGDWPTIARFWRRLPISDGEGHVDLVLQNPPFGDQVGIAVTMDHVVRAISIAPITLCILPLPYVAGEVFDQVWRYKRPAVIHRVIGRPWPVHLREVAVFEWDVFHDGPTQVADIRMP